MQLYIINQIKKYIKHRRHIKLKNITVLIIHNQNT